MRKPKRGRVGPATVAEALEIPDVGLKTARWLLDAGLVSDPEVGGAGAAGEVGSSRARRSSATSASMDSVRRTCAALTRDVRRRYN